MIVAGHQPNFLPWLGFFDKMAQADVFVIEDTVQFVRREFQNRNQIKTPLGVMWLTVPVEHNGRRQSIGETKIAERNGCLWLRRHFETLQACYARAPFWTDYSGFFEQTCQHKWRMLLDLNLFLIENLRRFLGVGTRLVKASSLEAAGKNTELIVAQCKELGADVYLSGDGARGYLDVEQFREEGIELRFQDFRHPVYRQVHGGFVPNLSVVDYLFCAGGKMWETCDLPKVAVRS